LSRSIDRYRNSGEFDFSLQRVLYPVEKEICFGDAFLFNPADSVKHFSAYDYSIPTQTTLNHAAIYRRELYHLISNTPSTMGQDYERAVT